MTDIEKSINIGVLGAGVVGGSVLEHYYQNKESLESTLGCPINIDHVLVNDPNKARSFPLPAGILTTHLTDITEDSNINLVVSLMGSSAEKAAIAASLNQGKYVVTANKVVISQSGPELFGIAKQNNVGLMFEAAVGGGIQIVDNLVNRYTPNRFSSVLGILNGTTNFILSKMAREGLAYSDVLETAQKLGYAEPDPTNDVEGYDARYKLSILASLAFRQGWVNPASIHCEGITKIHPQDFKNAADMGYAIKLIGAASDTGKGIEAWVAPVLLPQDHLLANINGALNGILLKGDPIGDVQLAGPGAGGGPTAASVWSDILRAGYHLQKQTSPSELSFSNQADLVPFDDTRHSNYVRMTITDGFGRVQTIGSIFNEHQVSINQILQLRDRKWVEDGVNMAEMAIDIDPSGEGNITRAMNQLSQEDFCTEIGSRFRMLD